MFSLGDCSITDCGRALHSIAPLENGFIRPPEWHGLGLSLAADILTRPDAILRTTEA
jgi:hypothetical protein